MQRKSVIVTIAIILAIAVGIFSFFILRREKTAGLKIESTPTASVFLDDRLVGKTPYEDRISSGDYILKLIPENTSESTTSWQGNITLNPSVLTYVNRDLGQSELNSAGEIVTLEKIDEAEAQISVFTKLESATVILDGQKREKTPVLIRDVIPGDHDIGVSSPGFIDRSVSIQAISGYKVVLDFQLAVAPESQKTSDESKQEETENADNPRVKINDTPTGFLRVREGPSTATKELTKVSPGDEFVLVGEENGWFKIEYEESREGWISGRYASKIK